jgi:hypothetical protein
MGIDALALWDGFPVERAPRPLELMDSTIGPGRLPQLEHRKQVLGARRVVSEVELPAGLLEQLQPEYPSDREPVRVTSVRRVWPEFRTDRGHRPLPAYRLDLAGEQWPPGQAPSPKLEGVGFGAMHVLDPWTEARLWWPERLSARRRGGSPGMSAAVLMDGERTVRMSVPGMLPSYGEMRVRAVHESRTAAVVEIEAHVYNPAAGMPLALVGHLVTLRLERALGARVLVLADGVPVQVMSAG